MSIDLENQCRKHWKQLRIKDEDSLKKYLISIFEKHDHQSDALIDVYQTILPDWDKIKSIDGFPEAGNRLWKFICDSSLHLTKSIIQMCSMVEFG
jgi:hypothetical protein